MPLYRIHKESSAVSIELREFGDQGAQLVEAFEEWQKGSCSCPPDEYRKVASMDVQHTGDTIRVRLESKPGATIDTLKVAARLDSAIAKTRKSAARLDGSSRYREIFDHVVYAVPDLEDAVVRFEAELGVRAGGGGQHLGLGTRNALLGLGSGSYVEFIAPDPAQPAPGFARPFGLDALERPRLVGWAVGCVGIDARVASARQLGYDPGDPVYMQRTTAAGASLAWRLTPNALGGGVIPFLIDWGDAVHPSQTAPSGVTVVRFHLEHPEPGSVAKALSALHVDVRIVKAPAPALVAGISGPRGRLELR